MEWVRKSKPLYYFANDSWHCQTKETTKQWQGTFCRQVLVFKISQRKVVWKYLLSYCSSSTFWCFWIFNSILYWSLWFAIALVFSTKNNWILYSLKTETELSLIPQKGNWEFLARIVQFSEVSIKIVVVGCLILSKSFVCLIKVNVSLVKSMSIIF